MHVDSKIIWISKCPYNHWNLKSFSDHAFSVVYINIWKPNNMARRKFWFFYFWEHVLGFLLQIDAGLLESGVMIIRKKTTVNVVSFCLSSLYFHAFLMKNLYLCHKKFLVAHFRCCQIFHIVPLLSFLLFLFLTEFLLVDADIYDQHHLIDFDWGVCMKIILFTIFTANCI